LTDGKKGDEKKTGDKSGIVDRELIRSLADLLTETGLSEIEVERAGTRVRVARQGMTIVSATPAPAATAAPPTASAPVREVNVGDGAHPGTVRSPMVGTAYRSAEPGARPFVEVGDTVKSGDTVLIVEAMKTMNQIPAPKAGTVIRIMVEDGQPVEYDEPLLIIE
jgi:acetyl-CoA carboxylase biotin carboxyl carrier protein